MKKSFKTILSVCVLALTLGLFSPAPVFAGAPLPDLITVLFNGHAPTAPLFSEVNFLPGDTVVRTIGIANIYSGPVNLSLKLDPYVDASGLGDWMDTAIKESGAAGNIFTGTMTALSQNPLVLSAALSAGNTVTYDFSVAFRPETENFYQGKSLSFDVLITAESQEGRIQTFGSTDGGGGSTGACSIAEPSIAVSNISQNSAVVAWTTTQFADSRVVYAAAGESFAFDSAAPPDFGHPHSVSDSALVTAHSLTLTGLQPGTVYYYRVVSCSPVSISYPHEFTTAQVAGEQIGILPEPTPPGFSGGTGALAPAIGGRIPPAGGTGQVLGEETEKPGETAGAAAEGEGTCRPHYPWWPIGYIVGVLLILGVYWYQNRRRPALWWLIPLGLLIATLLWWYLEPCGLLLWHWPAGIIFLFVLSSGWYLSGGEEEEQIQPAYNPQPPV